MGCMLFIQEVLCCGSYLAICQGTRPHANSLSLPAADIVNAVLVCA